MSQQISYKEVLNNQLPQDLYKTGKDIESTAVGNSLDRVQKNVDRLELEVNPLTSRHKGLECWENFFRLPSNPGEDVKIRRAKVITELIQFMGDENVIRKDEMESIASLYADDCSITEHFSEYMFDVELQLIGENEGTLDLNEIYKVIDKTKPSWLGYRLGIEFKPELNKIYIASLITSGEEITVYPYSITKLEVSSEVYIASGGNRGYEEVTVYPRKEVI